MRALIGRVLWWFLLAQPEGMRRVRAAAPHHPQWTLRDREGLVAKLKALTPTKPEGL